MLARNLCSKHYQRWRKEHPEEVRRTAREDDTLAERVALHSEATPDGCIRWVGYFNEGVPWLAIGGRGVNVRRALLAEIVPAPKGRYMAAQTCDTPNCIATDHLHWEQVTAAPDPAISAEDGARLAEQYVEGTLNVAAAARRFDVSRPTIYRALERAGVTLRK